jgi:hypothetical protein
MSLEILNNLSNFKVISLDEIKKGGSDKTNSSSGLSVIPNSSNKSEYKAGNLINLTLLIDDIRSNYLNLKNQHFVYEYKRYISNLEQTYILDDNKNHIDISAKINLKDGSVKLRPFGMDRPYMEAFFDANKNLSYALTFRFEDSMQTAIELKTNSFKEYRNLLLYLGYGDIEKDKQSSTFFIREFTQFLNSSNSSDDLYKVYSDIPLSFTPKIQLTTEKVVNHLKILVERDDTGFLSWTEDTSSLLIKVLGMFRKSQEVTDYFWKNPKLLNRIYDNLDGFSEILGRYVSNRIIFTSVLNEFAKKSKINKNRISTNTLKSGNGYFIESNILELNDTLNTIKGILSFDWDFDYKDSIFLQQKRTYKKNIQRQDITDEGKAIGSNKISETETITEDIDPGYLYHPLHLVHFLDEGEEKANLVTAIFIKALADEKEWEKVMQNIRIGGDILAIITGLLTLGSTSVLAIADIGLAAIDLTLMNDDVKNWLSQSPEGKWFVDNWDLIYGLVGAGIMSSVMIEGILTNGPNLLKKIKNLKNIRSNYRIFVQELEKLVTELDAYRVANPVDNAIEEVVINASKDSLLKKLIKKFGTSDTALNNAVNDLTKKGISVRKSGENVYEILYKDKVLKKGTQSETGAFLSEIYYKSPKKAEEFLENIIKEKPVGGKGPLGIGEVTGKYSKRDFNPKKAGGPILNLSWKNAEITKDGIEVVKKHLSRFEDVPANQKMIARLEKIEKKEISITDFDKRFYTHELREYERYKILGFEDIKNELIPDEVYNNAHSATLEDYKIYELDENRNSILYHPDIDQRLDFLSDDDKKILGL